MKKVYLILLFLTITCFTSQNLEAQAYAQNTATSSKIEGLAIYPNPVNAARPYINISSKHNLVKHVEIFDVLGKKVFSSVLTGKEINISNLQKGVYVLRISENSISETRKLVIK